jgi:bifunctional DNase/RNase
VKSKIKLRVGGLAANLSQSGTYTLVLIEEKGMRSIPIVVAMNEAQSIAFAMEKIVPPRPLTHDLINSMMMACSIHLLEVCIYKYEGGVFFAQLIMQQDKHRYRIDSRTSDAVAMAIRTGCNIYINEEVVDECSVILDESLPDIGDEFDDGDDDESDEELLTHEPDEIMDESRLRRWLSLHDNDSLELRLAASIEEENYENSKMYRDELRRREAKGEQTDD